MPQRQANVLFRGPWSHTSSTKALQNFMCSKKWNLFFSKIYKKDWKKTLNYKNAYRLAGLYTNMSKITVPEDLKNSKQK